jgi:signal peptidase I
MAYSKQKRLSEEEQQKTLPAFKKQYDLFDLLSVVPTFLAVFVIITGFFIGPAVVEGESMQPTFLDGDPVLIYYFMEEYHTDDVLIVDIGSELLIKRLCGMPGDHLKIDATGVYINDTLVESYVPEHYVQGEGLVPYFSYDQIIPEGSYFVMGDNRLNSTDGRRFGLVGSDQLLGIVILPNS